MTDTFIPLAEDTIGTEELANLGQWVSRGERLFGILSPSNRGIADIPSCACRFRGADRSQGRTEDL